MRPDDLPHDVSSTPGGSADAAPLAPAHVGERALLERLGRGGMGEVWRAIHLRTGVESAVKLIRPDLVSGWSRSAEILLRFQREARIAGQLDHPHVVPVEETGQLADGRHYLIMPLFRGGSLEDRREHFRDPTAAARLVAGIARAMHFVHQQGIVHRDLKPGNVLFRSDDPDSFAVSDFGLARQLAETGLTPANQFIGTLLYASPEQIASTADVDHRADVYALGVILFHLLTAEYPFDLPESWLTDEYRTGRQTAPPRNLRDRVPGAPEALAFLCRRCLQPNPARRYQDAAELAAKLEEFVLRSGGALRFLPAGYEEVRNLGEGGMGIVFHARRAATGEDVAVKVLRGVDTADLERFSFECEILADVEHPNVVRLFESGGPPQQPAPYYVMELLPGGSLSDRMATFRDPPEAIALASVLAQALVFLHQKDVVHRDFKPQNVLFRDDGTPCVTDLGLARAVGGPGLSTKEILGTPGYAAPEQGRPGVAIDGRADVYSLGIVLYEMLSGSLPPRQGDWRPSRHNPNVPAQLDQLCLGCLRENPAHRYDAAGLGDALAAVARGQWPSRAPVPRPAYRGVKLGRLDLAVRVLIGGDGMTRYRHPDGIVCTHRPERFAVPPDVLDATESWLADRIRESQRKGSPFSDGEQIRIDNWGLGLTEGRFERPHPIYLTTSLTSYFAMQRTNSCIDWLLPDRRTVREAHAGGIDDLDESRLANPLAVNLSVVTADNVVYVAQRGRKVGVNRESDPSDTARVPMVSGTASPAYDLDERGQFDPFLTAIREAKEEALHENFPLTSDHVTLFGLARTHGFLFPFLFGEARVNLDSAQFEAIASASPGDVRGKDGRPLTVEAVVPWMKELHRHDKENKRTLSHTAILSLYQSLIYAYPERLDEINALLAD